MPEPWLDEDVDCPHCAHRAEPEQDGDVVLYVCTNEECGAEFGHQRVQQDAGACQLGIPEDSRKRMGSLGVVQEPEPVFLGLNIGRRPE